MTDTGNIGLIDWHVFKDVSGTLFGLVIITGTTPTMYRFRSHRQLLLDDWMFYLCLRNTYRSKWYLVFVDAVV